MSVGELAGKVGITMANISVLKNGKARAIRLYTLEAICEALNCRLEIFWSTKNKRIVGDDVRRL
jgi:putative transcriptional regulator